MSGSGRGLVSANTSVVGPPPHSHSHPTHPHPLDLNAAGVLRLRSVQLHLQVCAGSEKNPPKCHNICSALSLSLRRLAISDASQLPSHMWTQCPSWLSIERLFFFFSFLAWILLSDQPSKAVICTKVLTFSAIHLKFLQGFKNAPTFLKARQPREWMI